MSNAVYSSYGQDIATYWESKKTSDAWDETTACLLLGSGTTDDHRIQRRLLLVAALPVSFTGVPPSVDIATGRQDASMMEESFCLLAGKPSPSKPGPRHFTKDHAHPPLFPGSSRSPIPNSRGRVYIARVVKYISCTSSFATMIFLAQSFDRTNRSILLITFSYMSRSAALWLNLAADAVIVRAHTRTTKPGHPPEQVRPGSFVFGSPFACHRVCLFVVNISRALWVHNPAIVPVPLRDTCALHV